MGQNLTLRTVVQVAVSLISLSNQVSGISNSVPGASSYVVSGGFPTSVFSSYYVNPAPTEEPQPAIYDPILNITFPLNLTDPDTIPDVDEDPVYYPQPVGNISDTAADKLVTKVTAQILAIIDGNGTESNCTKCKSALEQAKSVALVAPSKVPDMLVNLCEKTGFKSKSSCKENYESTNFGAIMTQVLALGDMGGLDGQYVCWDLSSHFCSEPTTTPLNTTNLFPKPKPANATAPQPSGERVKVLHLSDLHLDPRYEYHSEANCSSGLCCRVGNKNSDLASGDISFPAPLYGAYQCDTPYYLALAALQSIGPLTGTGNSSAKFAWSIYTGDLVSHDEQNQLSRAYTEYAETSIYSMLKSYISGPIFPVLGNHDTNPEAVDAPHSLPGPLGQQMSWNFDHVSALWQHEGWIDATAAAQARLHYGAYSIKTPHGLRIITLNTDFWYKSNYLNYINTTNPDNSNILKFLIKELQAAEDASERVWITGHVLTGWDGTNPLPNPTDLFYQIIDRYSPHVIANVFFGHTHEDQLMIFYANNGTLRAADTALTTAWLGPSITPLTNLNSGFRMYEVDTSTFDIMDAHTFYADVNSFPDLDSNTTYIPTGPTFQYEYSTRQTYGPAISWPSTAPLNATFWHRVTEAMEGNSSLIERFNTLQGKSSVESPLCDTKKCWEAKICYIRSASVALGRECRQGFGSVQSEYTG
ncbi:MAG: hypothetical protein M1834_009511 [Cirrosporium novae-zelandiae]|nr:MAG: hypothetical protein M1834_009511 [Cirrosporium novae-zelandiae]